MHQQSIELGGSLAGEDGALNMQLSRAPSLPNVLSTGSFKLVSGGSFSSPAAHYCPVCGIIATSEANLQVTPGY